MNQIIKLHTKCQQIPDHSTFYIGHLGFGNSEKYIEAEIAVQLYGSTTNITQPHIPCKIRKLKLLVRERETNSQRRFSIPILSFPSKFLDL